MPNTKQSPLPRKDADTFYKIGDQIEFEGMSIKVVNVDTFGATKHYGIMYDRPDGNCDIGWIPCCLLEMMQPPEDEKTEPGHPEYTWKSIDGCEQFTYNEQRKEFCSEASDLGLPVGHFPESFAIQVEDGLRHFILFGIGNGGTHNYTEVCCANPSRAAMARIFND